MATCEKRVDGIGFAQAKDHGIRIDGAYVNVTVARGRDDPPSGGDKSGAHAAIEQAMAMAQATAQMLLTLSERSLKYHFFLGAGQWRQRGGRRRKRERYPHHWRC